MNQKDIKDASLKEVDEGNQILQIVKQKMIQIQTLR